MAYLPCLVLLAVALLPPSSGYPRRRGSIQTTVSGTCASIGYTIGCCPPDVDCQASDGECFCSADCHKYNDCCADIVNVCLQSPSTCTALGFVDRCCTDVANMGYCEIETDDTTCSCQLSCHLHQTCCSDVGCAPQTCAEAGLDPGCCEGNCTVYRDTDDVCYCDEGCRDKGDCCEDVNKNKQCNKCTLTIVPGSENARSETQPRVPRPRLRPEEIKRRYQQRMRKLTKNSTVNINSPTRRAYVDKESIEQERLTTALEARLANVEVQRRKQTY